MRYRCRQCEYVSNEPGNCPTCNIPMEIFNEEEQGQPEVAPVEAPEAAPETPDVATPGEGDSDGGDSTGEGEETV